MSVVEELKAFATKINNNPVHIAGEKNRVFQIELHTSGTHQLVLEEGRVHVEEGSPFEAAVTLYLSDENFSKLLKDDLNTMMAFMTGGLKVEGNIGLALKLQEILKHYQ